MNDWSVCTAWLFTNNKYYLLNILRERLEHPALKNAVISNTDRWSTNLVLIEGVNARIALIQELKTSTNLDIYTVIHKDDKVMRVTVESLAIAAGKVYMPKEADWLATFQREAVLFPKDKHDDQIDSMSQFLKWAHHRQPAMQQLTCIVTPCYSEPPDLNFNEW